MSGPLTGLKILDFTALLPGPYATMMLADLGAQVLRIEAPQRPDLLRAMQPQRDGISAAHAHLNRGKRSLSLNLKHPKASAIITDLIAKAGYDIIIEGFRPQTMQKFGLSYDQLQSRFPELIYCSLTGYGQDGPDALKAGHDINYLSKSGVASYSGRKEHGPSPLGVQLADVAGGSCHAVIAMLSAVIHRQKTGVGQYCDISICDASLSLNALFAAGSLETETDPDYESNELNGGGLYDYYKCRDGRYLSFGALEPQFIATFFQVLGRSDLLVSFQEQRQTSKKTEHIKQELCSEIAKRDLQEWLQIFKNVEACVEGVLSFSEIVQDDQFQQRRMVVCLQDQDGRQWRQLGSPFKLSKTPVQYGLPGGKMGADNQNTMEAELGLSPQAIETLKAEGLFG